LSAAAPSRQPSLAPTPRRPGVRVLRCARYGAARRRWLRLDAAPCDLPPGSAAALDPPGIRDPSVSRLFARPRRPSPKRRRSAPPTNPEAYCRRPVEITRRGHAMTNEPERPGIGIGERWSCSPPRHGRGATLAYCARGARRSVCGVFFAVCLERGGPWDWSRDLREQDGWDEHARFMDSLVEEGFIVLGGPLADERVILHAIAAPSEDAVRERLAHDNWHENGMLTIKSIERWTILLDGRQA